MFAKFSIVALLLTLWVPLEAFSYDDSTDLIGWYFDGDATQRCIEGDPYDLVVAYLCLSRPDLASCSGGELRTVVDGNCYVVDWEVQGSGLNVGTPPEFVVGYGSQESAPQMSGGVYILCRATILLLDDQPVSLYVEPISNPSIPSEMAYVSFEDPGDLRVLVPMSGSHSLPTGWINSNDWPCVSSNRGPEYEVVVKTQPGTIEITNSAGGDLFGNVTVNSAPLAALMSTYQVEEVRRYTMSFPDSFTYRVRVTDEERVSYLARDLFVASLADSSSRELFASVCDSTTGVKYAFVPAKAVPALFPDDPYCDSHVLGGPSYTDVQHAWDIERGTSNIKVGVIDSGIDAAHPDFHHVPIGGDDGYIDGHDWSAHGTRVAGIIAAESSNDYGIAGMAKVGLFNISFPWDSRDSNFLEFIHRLIDEDVAVANFSGSLGSDLVLKNACAEYYNSNRILVAAAGNRDPINGQGPVASPANYSSVIAVGGIWDNGQLAYTNIGPEMDFTALAKDIETTTILEEGSAGHDYCVARNGTSYAAPQIAGAAALLLSYNPELYNDDVYNLLALSASTSDLVDPAPYSYSDAFGNGVVKVGAALDLLLQNAMLGGTGTGTSRTYETDMNTRTVFNIPGPNTPDGLYHVWRVKCEKDVTFAAAFNEEPHVWGRGAATTGIREMLANPITVDQKQVCIVPEQTVTTSGCTLVTWVYRFWSANTGTFWYPCAPENVQWGYAALGADGVVDVPQTGQSASLGVAPNPFNATVSLDFTPAHAGPAKVTVHDLRGRCVAELYSGHLEGTPVSFRWDGKDDAGNACASSVYVVRAVMGNSCLSRCVTMVK